MPAPPRCRPRTRPRGEQPLGGEQEPHLREHVPGNGRDHVDAQARPQPVRERLPSRRRPVSHDHLDRGSDRDLPARVGDQLELLVREVVAVDVRGVRPEQPHLVQLRDHGEAPGVRTHPDVDADWGADVARELPVVLHHLGRAEARPAGAHRERDQLVIAREVLVADAADVLGRLERALVPPVRERRVRRCRSSRRLGAGRPGERGWPRPSARACC